MTFVIDSVLDTYLDAYRGLIEVERVNGSAILSFPLHLAANHRIEITISAFGEGRCVISDSARTIGEIEAAGYNVSTQMKQKLERLAGLSGIRIVDGHLVLESSYEDLGVSIQKFLETSKTIGDVYLVHKQREKPDDEIILQIRDILDSVRLLYRTHEKIDGEIEAHPFDVVVPPNGRPGLAVTVVSGQNTHTLAQVWAFKCDDVKRGEWYRNAKAKLALVYDVRYQAWSDASRAIIRSRADIAVPSDSLKSLRDRLQLV